MKTPGDPRGTPTSPRLDWADAGTVAIQQLNRLQNRNDLLLGDAASGAVKCGLRGRVEDLARRPRTPSGGSTAIDRSSGSVSTTAGGTPYRVSRDDGSGDADHQVRRRCDGVAGLDEDARLAVFPRVARQRRPNATCIASRLDGTGTPERVTPAISPEHTTTTFRRTDDSPSTPTPGSTSPPVDRRGRPARSSFPADADHRRRRRPRHWRPS